MERAGGPNRDQFLAKRMIAKEKRAVTNMEMILQMSVITYVSACGLFSTALAIR